MRIALKIVVMMIRWTMMTRVTMMITTCQMMMIETRSISLQCIERAELSKN